MDWKHINLKIERLVTPRFQRSLKPERVTRILREFDENRVKVPYIARAGDELLTLDGQHTIEVLRQKDYEEVKCLVAPMSYEEAGQLFRWFNTDAQRLSNYDDWLAGREIGDPTVLRVDDAVESLGLKIAGGSGPKSIACIWHIKQMLVVANGGVGHIAQVLKLVNTTWDGEDQLFRGEIVAGVSQIIRKYDGKVDEKRAVRVWGRKWTPRALVLAAKERNVNEDAKHENTISALLVKAYDRGLPTKSRLRPDEPEEF